jgi:hypothetical protein
MRSSKERMCIGKKREVVEKGREGMCWENGGGREGKGRNVFGGAPRAGPIQLKSERFCGKGAKSAARRARPARPPEGRRADAHAERRERDNEQQMPGQASL